MSQKTEVVITARDETRAAIASAQRNLQSLTGGLSGLKSAATSLVPILGGISGALSIGAFAASVANTIQFTAALDDMAERTGATVENLSALAGVAKIGGHDLATFETGILKLNKVLHGSDDEAKGAAKALAAIGLSVDELKAKDPAQAMLDVAIAMEKFADGGGKTAVALALIPKTGAQLLPFMKDLAETGDLIAKVTAEQAAQAEQYEKNMARLGTALGSTAKIMALEFLPTLSRMSGELVAASQAAGGFWNYFTQAATVNPLKSVQENIKAIGAEAAALEDKISIGRGSKGDDEQLGKLNSKLKILRAIDDVRKKQLADGLGIGDIEKKKSLDDFKSTPDDKPKKAKKEADDAARLLESLREKIALNDVDLQSTEKLTAAEKEAAKVKFQLESGLLKATAAQDASIRSNLNKVIEQEKSLAAQEDYRKALESQESTNVKNSQAMLEQIASVEKANELYGLSASQITAVAVAHLEDATALAAANGAYPEHLAFLEEETKKLRELGTAQEGGDLKALLANTKSAQEAARAAKVSTLDRALAAGKIDPKQYKEAIDGLKGEVDSLDEFTKQAARNMQDAMAEFFIDPTKGGIQSLAKSFGQTVQKMIAQAAAAQLGKILFGDMGKTGEVGGLVGSIPWAQIFAAATFKDGGIMTSSGPVPLRKYASGGIANSAQLAMFGEGSTPEAYVPLPDGRRIPVHMQGGGQPVNQIMNFYGAAEPAQVKRAAASGARSVLGMASASARYA